MDTDLFNETGACNKCQPNCNSCNFDYKLCDAVSCENGYGPNNNGGCDRCPQHCKSCNSNNEVLRL